jgi:hypothetical protein
MFDIMLRYEHAPIKTLQGTGIKVPHTTHHKLVQRHTKKGEAAQQQHKIELKQINAIKEILNKYIGFYIKIHNIIAYS